MIEDPTYIVLFKMPINFEGCGLKKVPTKLFLRNVSGPAPPIASLINDLVSCEGVKIVLCFRILSSSSWFILQIKGS